MKCSDCRNSVHPDSRYKCRLCAEKAGELSYFYMEIDRDLVRNNIIKLEVVIAQFGTIPNADTLLDFLELCRK